MNGAYDLEGVIWHQHSNKLMKEILKLFPKEEPIIDLGCGHNFYVSVLRLYGNEEAIGVDMVDMGNKFFRNVDLSKPFRSSYPFVDYLFSTFPVNVISLEVGEHLHSDKSEIYLDNVASFGGNVLMSWAIPGQAGHGHINCQPNSWVIEEMRKRGYAIDFQKTHDLRQAVSGCHCRWFINTLMYFNRAR